MILLMILLPLHHFLTVSFLYSLIQMAARMGQLDVYLPTVLTNPSAGTIQPVNKAAGLTNPEQQGIVPTVGTLSAGVPQRQGAISSGLHLNTHGFPAGLERPTREAATVQTPAEPKLQPTQADPF